VCRCDIDLLVELHSDDLEVHTRECLTSVCSVLCSPSPAHASPAVQTAVVHTKWTAMARKMVLSLLQSGWKLEEKSLYYLWLSHPLLGLSLDIKVGYWMPSTKRLQLLLTNNV
jgi:hypothetical protein